MASRTISSDRSKATAWRERAGVLALAGGIISVVAVYLALNATAGRDRAGPVSVGMEVAFRVVTPPGTEPRQGRLVVYGNSEFANNPCSRLSIPISAASRKPIEHR